MISMCAGLIVMNHDHGLSVCRERPWRARARAEVREAFRLSHVMCQRFCPNQRTERATKTVYPNSPLHCVQLTPALDTLEVCVWRHGMLGPFSVSTGRPLHHLAGTACGAATDAGAAAQKLATGGGSASSPLLLGVGEWPPRSMRASTGTRSAGTPAMLSAGRSGGGLGALESRTEPSLDSRWLTLPPEGTWGEGTPQEGEG